jgi:intracellular sulfur oxidation DsrE/DsrF family protein
VGPTEKSMKQNRRGVLVAAFGVAALVAGGMAERAGARPDTHRVVLELTSDDPKSWEAVMNNVENVRKALGRTSVEIVTHGRGLSLLVGNHAGDLTHRMEQAARDGVVFAACQNTMNRQKLTPKDLVGFAKPVDSGVAEVVRKQEAGWSYLRSGL